MNPPHVYPDLETLSRSLAARWLDHARESITQRGGAHMVLAGGGTPRRLYRVLAESALEAGLDWGRVHIYFSDERCVPPDHPDSNYRMAREALLDHVPIPTGQVHPILSDISSIRLDAARYAGTLDRHVPTGPQGMPCFDLVLLGLGEDGHTASLFPGTCILHERERPVAAVYIPQLRGWRISLTYPALRQARALWVMAAGAAKADILQRIWQDPAAGLPVQALADLVTLEWHLDEAAAGHLPA